MGYFTGATNTVQSYNWDGTNACATGCQLANQDYNVCFRTEAGMCGINYTPTTVDAGSNAFQLPAAAFIDTYCGDHLSNDDDATWSGVISSNQKPFRFRHAVIGDSVQNGAGFAGFSIDATQTPC